MRRTLVALSLALAGLLGLSRALAYGDTSWPVNGHDAAGTYSNPTDRGIGPANVMRLHRVWSVPHVRAAIASPGLVFGLIGDTAESGSVVVLDARNGHVLRRLTRASLRLSSRSFDVPVAMAYSQGRLIVASPLTVIALDPLTGHQLWRVPGGAYGLTISGSVVYTSKFCTSICGPLTSMAINLRTGRVLWQHRGNGAMAPVMVGGHLFQVWGNQTRVYDPQLGQLLATLPGAPQWLGDDVNTFAFLSVLPALDGETPIQSWLARIGPLGKPVWRVMLGVPSDPSGDGNAAYADGLLYVPSNRFHPGAVAVDARTGKIRWGADVGAGLALISANHLVFAVHQSNNQVDILNGRNGHLLRRIAIAGGSYGQSSALVSGGTLYVATGQALVALRP